MNKRILFIGTVWPEPKSSAAGSRMIQLISLFSEIGNTDIHFASASTPTNRSFDIEKLGVTAHDIILNHSSFDEFIKKLNPTIVVFDRFMTEEQYGWRVAENCPETIRILDTEDLHFLRKARQQAIKERGTLENINLINDIAKREIASIYRCDLSLIISEFEMSLIKQTFKIDDSILCYLPFIFDDISNKDVLPKYKDRGNFVTIGNFLHAPNVDAIRFLKQEIWPLIRQALPEVEMHIYGAYSSDKILQLKDEKSGFLINGFVKDVNEVMQQARACLVPLRFGAGLKGKLFDAMINGTPCVTTSIGAEGVFGSMQVNGFIEDNATDFAKRAIELYTNETIWQESQERGFDAVNKRFSKRHFINLFDSLIKELLFDYTMRRKNNFVGQMLLHNSMQSTKYMSKWIEEKNKKAT